MTLSLPPSRFAPQHAGQPARGAGARLAPRRRRARAGPPRRPHHRSLADPFPRARPVARSRGSATWSSIAAAPACATARSCRSRPTRCWSRPSSARAMPASATPSSTSARSPSRRTHPGAAAPSMRSPARSTAARRCRRAIRPMPRCRTAAGAGAPARRHGLPHRRQGHRHLHADLLRPAPRHLRRLRRRQVDAARHARRAPTPSTRSSSRWSASAAAKCANSSRTRSARTAWPRPSPSSRPATKAP